MGSCQAGRPSFVGIPRSIFQVTAVPPLNSSVAANNPNQGRKADQQLATESVRSARSPERQSASLELGLLPFSSSSELSASQHNCHEAIVGLSDPQLPRELPIPSRIGGGEFVPSPSPCGSPAPLRNLHRIVNQQIHSPAVPHDLVNASNFRFPEPASSQPILGQLGQSGQLGQLDQLDQLIQWDQSARRKHRFSNCASRWDRLALGRAARQYRTPYVVNYRPRKQRRGWLRLRTRSPSQRHTPTRPTRRPT